MPATPSGHLRRREVAGEPIGCRERTEGLVANLTTHRGVVGDARTKLETHASILRRAGRRRIGRPPNWHPYETSEGGFGASAAAAATAAASARLRTPSLASTRPTWCSTVFTEMKRRSPISGLG